MKQEIKKLNWMIARNIKLYFKDKMMFLCSLITPLILIVLFLTFLGDTYKGVLINSLPEGFELSKRIINGFTGGWLFSSILATSCLTVAFCSNMVITDKINNTFFDFQIAPIKRNTAQLSYVISNFLTTFIVCFTAMLVGFVYLGIVGWYLSIVDVLLIILNMVLNIMFSTLLSSLVWLFVSTQGGCSAVCTLVSSMYGFLCGAYMPIYSMGSGVRAVVSFLPGTYSTVLFRQAFMNGVLREIGKDIPQEAVDGVRKSFDGSFFFFKHEVPTWAMYVVVISSILVLLGVFLLCVYLKNKNIHVSLNHEKKTKKNI